MEHKQIACLKLVNSPKIAYCVCVNIPISKKSNIQNLSSPKPIS